MLSPFGHRHGIRQVVVDGGEAGGVARVKPVQRDGSGFARKCPEAVALGLPCNIHQHINTVGPDACRQFVIGHLPGVDPVFEQGPVMVGDLVLQLYEPGVGKKLDAGGIMVFQQRP